MSGCKVSLSALRRGVAGLTALLILGVMGWIAYVVINRPARSSPDTSEWRTGDIFFSVGDSWKSVTVRSLTGIRELGVADSTPSHCGIILISPSGPLLIHASTTAERIVAETPREYMRNNGSYCLYAMEPPCPVDTVRLRADVDSMIRAQIPFDFKFDHSDSSALYCTEMVVALLESNGCSRVSALRESDYIYPHDLAKICRKRK